MTDLATIYLLTLAAFGLVVGFAYLFDWLRGRPASDMPKHPCPHPGRE
jgi:hypothetical protein